jgi:hypothetical protein
MLGSTPYSTTSYPSATQRPKIQAQSTAGMVHSKTYRRLLPYLYSTTTASGLFSVLLLVMVLLVVVVVEETTAQTLAFAPTQSQRSAGSLLSMGRRSFASVFDVMQVPVDDDAPRVDFDNFWRKTVANYTACEKPDRTPDFKSGGGSLYWKDGTAGVIRHSDHWSGQFGCGMIKDCYWTIDIDQPIKNQCLTGRCDFADFYKGKKKSMKKRQKWSVRKN